MITFHHAITRVAQDCTSVCPKTIFHPRGMSHSLPHLTLTTSTSSLSPTSPIFPTLSPTHTRPSVHDPYLPSEDPRQNGGSTQIPSLTGYEPKSLEKKAVEPEDLEPGRIEIDRNLGTDPYQAQERIMEESYQNPIAEDMDEIGKVGVEVPYIQSEMHSDYDSAESIADSHLEDREKRKCWLYCCIYRGEGRGDHECSRIINSFRETGSSKKTEERSKCTTYSS